MKINDSIKLIFILFSSVLLSSCVQSSADITSNKLNAYHPDVKRLLVFADLGAALKNKMDGDEEQLFISDFTNSLNNCGITTEFHQKDPLALQDEKPQFIRNFVPDTILTIDWKSAVTSNRAPMSIVYIASIIDMKTKRVVWKAEINFRSAWYGAQTLAASLINNLKQQSIISSSCVAPVIPKA